MQQWSKKNIYGVVVFLIIVTVLIATIVWLFISGRLVWADKDRMASNAGHIVCNDEMVAKYNEASTMLIRGNDTTKYSIDQKGIDEIATDINTKSGRDDDPTCQTILFWAAVNKQDYNAAKSANTKIQALHKKHIYINSNLKMNGPVSTYDSVLYTISPDSTKKPDVPLGN